MLTAGLVADRGTPIKRVWARSDWPLAERVYGRVDRPLCSSRPPPGSSTKLRERGHPGRFAALKLLANQLARDLPVDIRTKRDDFWGWAERAGQELSGLDGPDRKWCDTGRGGARTNSQPSFPHVRISLSVDDRPLEPKSRCGGTVGK